MKEKRRLTVNIVAQIVSFAVSMGINFLLTPFIVNKLGACAVEDNIVAGSACSSSLRVNHQEFYSGLILAENNCGIGEALSGEVRSLQDGVAICGLGDDDAGGNELSTCSAQNALGGNSSGG